MAIKKPVGGTTIRKPGIYKTDKPAEPIVKLEKVQFIVWFWDKVSQEKLKYWQELEITTFFEIKGLSNNEESTPIGTNRSLVCSTPNLSIRSFLTAFELQMTLRELLSSLLVRRFL